MKQFHYLSVAVQAQNIDLKPTADAIEGCANKYAAEGWRLHQVLMLGPGCAICVFEREIDTEYYGAIPGHPGQPYVLRQGEVLLNNPSTEGGERPVLTTR